MIRSNGRTRDDLTIVGASIYRELRLAAHPAEPAQPNNNFLCPVICLFGEGRSCLACRGRRVRSHTKGQGAGRQYRRPPDAVAKGCRRTKLGEARPWASGRNGGDVWVRWARCPGSGWSSATRRRDGGLEAAPRHSTNQSEGNVSSRHPAPAPAVLYLQWEPAHCNILSAARNRYARVGPSES